MIEVRDLVKRYGDHTAVDGLSFTIEDGKIYGFLGPNGAGKSTTMNIMTGYIGPTSGQVIINGHNILEEPEEAKKCIGYLPELPPLYQDMTVGEYLSFAQELKGIPKSERGEDLERIISMTGLEDVEGRLIANLSKGYRQRVGLAQAISGFPEIIILDEPTVGLDPNQIIEIRELIRNLAKSHTVILSSHILSEVQEVCDKIIIIHKGHLVANGTTEELEQEFGANSMELTAKTEDYELIKDTVKNIPGVLAVKKLDAHHSGETSVSLKLKKDSDVREAVFRAFSAGSVPLLMMKADSFSLERVFIQLTQDVYPVSPSEKEADVNAPDAEKKEDNI